jgi:demethylmenaquinone methyltransferase/2-methoxy-6-polyprenyl-1,4-benzoquinol methylase
MTKTTPNQPEQERVRKRYDGMARAYAATGQLIVAHRQEATVALGVQPGEHILDLACGPGVNFKSILKDLGTGGLLVGLDYSSGMIEQAQQRVKVNEWSNATPLLGDAARLPFADCEFDRVLGTYSFSVIPDYQQAFDEVARVLKPGGTLVVLDGKSCKGPLRFLNPLVNLLARAPVSDLTRPLTYEIAQRFQVARTTEYDFGFTFLAIAYKKKVTGIDISERKIYIACQNVPSGIFIHGVPNFKHSDKYVKQDSRNTRINNPKGTESICRQWG